MLLLCELFFVNYFKRKICYVFSLYAILVAKCYVRYFIQYDSCKFVKANCVLKHYMTCTFIVL